MNALICHGDGRLGRSECNSSCSLSMTNGLAGNTVFAELIHQAACKDKIEKLVHLREDLRQQSLLPTRTPEYCENLNGSDERPVTVRQLRGGGWREGLRVWSVKRNNSDGVFGRMMRHLFRLVFYFHEHLT